MTIDLTGQAILVTGASRGIGQALAIALGQAGATVGVHFNGSRTGAEKVKDILGDRAVLMQANLANVAACEQLFQEAIQRMGRLDTLINNAAVSLNTPEDADTATWLADWELTMHVNLRATELLCRLAIAHYKEQKGGRIINIASRAAFRGDLATYMTYAASKGGMVALTRSIARAFGKQGIKAFIIAPGFIRTDMAQDFIDRYGEAYVKDDIAVDTLTEPEDLAPLITLLASGLADHATGGTFDVNGGSYVH